MAFCAQCGSQLNPGAAACSACGAATGNQGGGSRPSQIYSPWGKNPTGGFSGFVSSLFDVSFTNFITPKLIKVLFVISIVLAAFGALAVVGSAFMTSAIAGIFALLIVAPLLFLFYVIYARVMMEVLIVIFRGSEHLAEIAKQGRR